MKRRVTITINDESPILPLCFEDGDVLVELSSSPLWWLLVHKKVLEVAMPPLSAALNNSSEPKKIVRTSTREEVEVWHLRLEMQDGAFTLVAKVGSK